MAVYFIQNQKTGHIKIGKSIAVNKRLNGLSREVGDPLELLGVIEGYSDLEYKLHSQFQDIRIHGEWFMNSPELLEFISKKSIPLCDLDDSCSAEVTGMPSVIGIIAQEQGYSTPEALSKKTNLTRATIYNVWKGDISRKQFGTMVIIAKALNVAIADLHDGIV